MDDAATTTCRARTAAFLAIADFKGALGAGANDFLQEMLRCRDGASAALAQRTIAAILIRGFSILIGFKVSLDYNSTDEKRQGAIRSANRVLTLSDTPLIVLTIWTRGGAAKKP